ncbi:suppressor/enhancer of lin-12 protein 9 [Clonorchis sinensis]|uniref:Suppressor/enhancer of lin-12 protein 9 n=1 Tax=Clonorchis sinensis TaxID=79923 RepID=G7YN44_CLOSI|nr:suppressor/enhancer of lin-12 protein 9 [Clonorchis sinensis]
MAMWLLLALSLFSWRPCCGFYVDIDANGEECFIERIPPNKKFTLHYEVAEGGFLDIDAAVYGPDGKLMYNEIKKPNGRPKFVASKGGSYKYCFGNKMSSLTPKVVLFELEVEEDHLQAEDKDDDAHKKLVNMVNELSHSIESVKLEMEYVALRTNIHWNSRRSGVSNLALTRSAPMYRCIWIGRCVCYGNTAASYRTCAFVMTHSLLAVHHRFRRPTLGPPSTQIARNLATTLTWVATWLPRVTTESLVCDVLQLNVLRQATLYFISRYDRMDPYGAAQLKDTQYFVVRVRSSSNQFISCKQWIPFATVSIPGRRSSGMWSRCPNQRNSSITGEFLPKTIRRTFGLLIRFFHQTRRMLRNHQ